LQPDGVNLLYFKLRLFDLIEIMKYQRSKTSGCIDMTIANQSLRQKLNSFDSNLQIPRWHSGSGLHTIGFKEWLESVELLNQVLPTRGICLLYLWVNQGVCGYLAKTLVIAHWYSLIIDTYRELNLGRRNVWRFLPTALLINGPRYNTIQWRRLHI